MKLTYRELLALFQRDCFDRDLGRYVANADSQEYLNVVLYLVARNRR